MVKTIFVGIRLTPEEKQRLEFLAEHANLNRSRAVAQLIDAATGAILLNVQEQESQAEGESDES